MSRFEQVVDPERGTLVECIDIVKKVVSRNLEDKSNYLTWSLDMITAFKCMKLRPIEDSDDDATEKHW